MWALVVRGRHQEADPAQFLEGKDQRLANLRVPKGADQNLIPLCARLPPTRPFRETKLQIVVRVLALTCWAM